VELNGRLIRMQIDGSEAKFMPKHVVQMKMSFNSEQAGVFGEDRLVEIQFVYDAAYSRLKSVDALTDDLALNYGPARRSQSGRYWWRDGKTVWLVFDESVPVKGDGGQDITELRTSLEFGDSDLYRASQ